MAELSLSQEEIALIEFKTHHQAKRLKISASSTRGLVLTAPKWASLECCTDFLQDNARWIRKQIQALELKRKEKSFTRDTEYKTFYRELKLIPSAIKESRSLITDTKIKFYYDQNIQLESCSKSQKAIKETIIEVLRTEAKDYLPQRLDYFSCLNQINYKSLRLKDMKSQWGSCSRDNNINLSIHLMRLPTELIDYVICHELIHILEKNHSKIFWDKLENILSGAKNLDVKMKNYHPEIFI